MLADDPEVTIAQKARICWLQKRLKNNPQCRKGRSQLHPSVVARRLLRLKWGDNLVLLVERTPTTQEVETTSGFGHEGHLQANRVTLLVDFGGADDFRTHLPVCFRYRRRGG
jgi:hypothetical protein